LTNNTTTRHRGTCKFFGGHSGAVDAAGLKTLDAGQRVEFQIITDGKNGKLKAVALKLI
jgi:cold shock CspA family protein